MLCIVQKIILRSCVEVQALQHVFVQVSGKVIPKPVKNWNQCGISSKVMDVLKKAGLADPMPIQVCPPLLISHFL